MAQYKATNSKQSASSFRGTWRNQGLDVMTKELVALYEETEKPTSDLEFLKHLLGAFWKNQK
jgi:hypothetical protein